MLQSISDYVMLTESWSFSKFTTQNRLASAAVLKMYAKVWNVWDSKWHSIVEQLKSATTTRMFS